MGLLPAGLNTGRDGGAGDDQGGGAAAGFGEAGAAVDGFGDGGLVGLEEVEQGTIGLAVAAGAAAAAGELLVVHLDQGLEQAEGFILAGGKGFHQPGDEVVEDLGPVGFG